MYNGLSYEQSNKSNKSKRALPMTSIFNCIFACCDRRKETNKETNFEKIKKKYLELPDPEDPKDWADQEEGERHENTGSYSPDNIIVELAAHRGPK